MNLESIKGSYDAIISLGDLCLGSIQLKKNNLRNFSGVLDWMASPFLKDVSRLVKNKFIGFFDEENLRIIGYAGDDVICVADDGYNFVSNHDFYVKDGNTLTSLASYPQVREKFDRRIERTLEKMENGERLLFVRTEGSQEEAAELEKVLSKRVANDFCILLINHTAVQEVTPIDWGLEKTCVLEFPDTEKWNSNDHLWQEVLSGITIKGDALDDYFE
ncbi:peptidase [Bacillus mangrovi]|uniref:Peptidase n=1 Tax=Metabacillus mangrovi TaxID=1491830 RepID=A0A7X2S1U8_9BACI|nr:DUF1796 family putative cysteine peptidase [Metabacillus mangrovi]MTH52040.1 peptidase [Metabacillus mangrovi]